MNGLLRFGWLSLVFLLVLGVHPRVPRMLTVSGAHPAAPELH